MSDFNFGWIENLGKVFIILIFFFEEFSPTISLKRSTFQFSFNIVEYNLVANKSPPKNQNHAILILCDFITKKIWARNNNNGWFSYVLFVHIWKSLNTLPLFNCVFFNLWSLNSFFFTIFFFTCWYACDLVEVFSIYHLYYYEKDTLSILVV